MQATEYAQVLQELTNTVQGHVGELREKAVSLPASALTEPISLKRQLQGLKSTISNLGQKCTFAEALASEDINANLKAEVERIATAVENAEDDLKDFKTSNKQDEQSLIELIQTMASKHEQIKDVASRVQQRLQSLSVQEEMLQQANRAYQEVTSTGLVNAGNAGNAISQATSRAAELESQLCARREQRQRLESDLAAELARVQELQAQIREHEATLGGDAELEKQRDMYHKVLNMVRNVTGVDSVSMEPGTTAVTLTLTDATTASQTPANKASHKLRVVLRPGSLKVTAATLDPPTVSMSGLAKAATDHDWDVAGLVAAVQQRLFETGV